MPVKDLCFRESVTISQHASLTEAARLMKRERVGALIVTKERDKPIGILTDRDIVLHAAAEGKSMRSLVSEVMSRDLLLIPREAGVANVIEKMEGRGVRRAVVVDEEGRLCGLVSADDLLQLLRNELNSLANLVGRQVSRRRPPRDI